MVQGPELGILDRADGLAGADGQFPLFPPDEAMRRVQLADSVYRIDACGYKVELEDQRHPQGTSLLKEALPERGTPPADVRRRVAQRVNSVCGERASRASRVRWERKQPKNAAEESEFTRLYDTDFESCVSTTKAEYLGSDPGGMHYRRRYWFAIDGLVFFVSHRFGAPNCRHTIVEELACPA